jgi:hypothetical protein
LVQISLDFDEKNSHWVADCLIWTNFTPKWQNFPQKSSPKTLKNFKMATSKTALRSTLTATNQKLSTFFDFDGENFRIHEMYEIQLFFSQLM